MRQDAALNGSEKNAVCGQGRFFKHSATTLRDLNVWSDSCWQDQNYRLSQLHDFYEQDLGALAAQQYFDKLNLLPQKIQQLCLKRMPIQPIIENSCIVNLTLNL